MGSFFYHEAHHRLPGMGHLQNLHLEMHNLFFIVWEHLRLQSNRFCMHGC